MIWKCRVGFGEKLDHLNTEFAINRNGGHAAHAVTGVDDGFEFSRSQIDARYNVAAIIAKNILSDFQICEISDFGLKSAIRTPQSAIFFISCICEPNSVSRPKQILNPL